MWPITNQPTRLFTTAKMHKFLNFNDINIFDLKLCPIIDETGTYLYDCSKVIPEYLNSLASNDYTISDALSFPLLFKDLPLD